MINDELLYDVAYAYYIKGKLQKEIAEEYGVSRVQIGKYLKRAQERGIVKISVDKPNVDIKNLNTYQKFFSENFGLKKLVLSPGANTKERLLSNLCRTASKYIANNFDSREMKVGIGWGETLFNLVNYFEGINRSNWLITPLSGGTSKLSDKFFNVNYIIQVLSGALKAKPIPMYFSFILKGRKIAEEIKKTNEYLELQRLWDNLDIIISSVGYSLSRSPLFRQNVLDGSYSDKLEELKVVGDILTHYYDINGKMFNFDFKERWVNLSLEQYLKTPNKIVVAGGHHKVDSIIGLIKGNFCDCLITDEKTIKFVYEYFKEAKEEI